MQKTAAQGYLESKEKQLKRRRIARKIESVRERLLSDSDTRPDFDYEMTLLYGNNRESTGFVLLAVFVAVAGILFLWSGGVFALGWLATISALHLLLIFRIKAFKNADIDYARLKIWQGNFYLLEFLYGVAWAGLVFMPMNGSGSMSWQEFLFAHDVFLFGLLILIVSVQTTACSSLPNSVLAGAIPITLAIMLVNGFSNEVYNWVMAVMAGASFGFFYTLVLKLRNASLHTLEHRAEKDMLIAELEQANTISDEARRRAEEANLAKSRFLATMSHELRTPLNAILGFSEIIKDQLMGPIGNDKYKDYAKDIHSSGSHLLNLINEILDLSRIEAGRKDLVEEWISLIELTEYCCHMLDFRSRQKSIKIIEDYEYDLPLLWADQKAVRQVILNLLSNAVKFTPTGGQVKVTCGWTRSGGQYLLVEDTGPGIPEHEIPVVLSQFGQGSLAQKTAEQGTGLGLPIVQALVKMHGGDFRLTSKLRKGTRVVATFPASRVMQDGASAGNADATQPKALQQHGDNIASRTKARATSNLVSIVRKERQCAE